MLFFGGAAGGPFGSFQKLWGGPGGAREPLFCSRWPFRRFWHPQNSLKTVVFYSKIAILECSANRLEERKGRGRHRGVPQGRSGDPWGVLGGPWGIPGVPGNSWGDPWGIAETPRGPPGVPVIGKPGNILHFEGPVPPRGALREQKIIKKAFVFMVFS